MLLCKIKTGILKDFFRAIPVIDEFCIISITRGKLNLSASSSEDNLFVKGIIPGESFDYLMANDLEFAINLIKLKNFIDGAFTGTSIEISMSTKDALLNISTSHIERQFNCLHPENVEQSNMDIPSYKIESWVVGGKDLSVIIGALSQIDSDSFFELREGGVIFSSFNETDRVIISEEYQGDLHETIGIFVSTKHLGLVKDHIGIRDSVGLQPSNKSPLHVRVDIPSGCKVHYLIPRLGNQ